MHLCSGHSARAILICRHTSMSCFPCPALPNRCGVGWHLTGLVGPLGSGPSVWPAPLGGFPPTRPICTRSAATHPSDHSSQCSNRQVCGWLGGMCRALPVSSGTMLSRCSNSMKVRRRSETISALGAWIIALIIAAKSCGPCCRSAKCSPR